MSYYNLYVHRNSYAMTVQLMLEELAVDYKTTWFNVHRPEEFPKDFRALNPNVRVPVLITDNGPIYESGAIMLYLSEQHGHRFMPNPDEANRGKALQWLFYLMSTFQPEVLIQFNAERYYPDDEAMRESIKTESRRELERLWYIIDEQLRDGPYFMGKDYTACDMLFLMQAIWEENQPANLKNFASARKMMLEAFRRPAVKKVIEVHEIKHLTNI